MGESLQSKNRRRGRDFERKKMNELKRGGQCIVAGRIGETSTNVSTPDVFCLQGGDHPKLRLIEAKINGYVPPDQRDEIISIVEESEENFDELVQFEIFHRTSPRKSRNAIVHTPGKDVEKTRERLEEEFSRKHFEPDMG